MDLRWLWLGVVLVVVVVAVAASATRMPARRRRPADAVFLAHAQRLRRVPRYASLLRQQQVAMTLRCAAALFLLAGTVLLVSRPFSEETRVQSVANRDIMLCLDVSGSMVEYDEQITREFARIAESLEGERIGLTIWNEVGVTVFPLTDDYDFVAEELDRSAEALGSHDFTYTAGTMIGRSASQIGDGLASCVDRFDRPDEERGRAVVLASDNDPQGKGVFTLDEAAEYAAGEDVVVYGFGTPNMDLLNPGARQGFEAAVESAGGQLQIMGEGSLGGIVDGIQRLETQRLEKPPEVIVHDQPWWGAGLSVAGVVLTLVAGVGRRT